MDDEINLEKFVGDDYDKINNEKFSLPVLLLGGCYLAYRKMIIEAVAVCIAEIIIMIIGLSILPFIIFLLLFIGIRVGEAFLFKKVYFNYAKTYINKITNIENHSEVEIEDLIKKNGGKAIIFLTVFTIVYVIIALIIGIVALTKSSNNNKENNTTVNNAPVNTTTEKPSNTENSNNTNSATDSSKKTVTENDGSFSFKFVKNVNIRKFVDVSIPEEFKELSNEDYLMNYYYGDTTFSTDIIFKIGQVSADSAKDFIEKVVAAKNLSEDDMYSVELNDITWYIVGYESNGKIVYYNAFDNSDAVFLYRFEIDNSSNESLGYLYEDIILSIKAKKNNKNSSTNTSTDFSNTNTSIDNSSDNSSTNSSDENSNGETENNTNENVVE